MNSFEEKVNRLSEKMDQLCREDVAIAFSGGVDSSLVLKLASEKAKIHQTKVYAVTVHTKLHPVGELEVSKAVAKETGAIHKIFEVDELQNAGILNNPENRCYLCKKFIFTQLVNFAAGLKINNILEGTNADDLKVYRPGIKALRELKVNSPLADAGMTKIDIRQLAKEYNITVADRPSAPCMATRFPYNTPISYEKMVPIEKGENYLRELGFYNVRIRIHDDIARIEVDGKDLEKFMQLRVDIIKELKDLGFEYVTLDLEGFRSGSMDYKLLKRTTNAHA